MSNYNKELKELKTKLEDLEEKINRETVKTSIAEQRIEWEETCSKKLNWGEAKDWCEMKGDGWRLPTVVELLQAHEDNLEGFSTGFHWSSTETSTTLAKSVNFSDGGVAYYDKTGRDSVRCVRDK